MSPLIYLFAGLVAYRFLAWLTGNQLGELLGQAARSLARGAGDLFFELGRWSSGLANVGIALCVVVVGWSWWAGQNIVAKPVVVPREAAPGDGKFADRLQAKAGLPAPTQEPSRHTVMRLLSDERLSPSSPSPFPKPVPAAGRWSLKSVVRSERTKKPITDVTVRFGNQFARSGENGEFLLSLSASRDEIGADKIRFAHDAFHDLDIPISDVGDVVSLAPKRVVTVVPFLGTLEGQPFKDLRPVIVQCAENRFAKGKDFATTAGENLERVVEELHRINFHQQALYDENTLTTLGNFHGSTHALFGRISSGLDGYTLMAELVELKTAQKVSGDMLVLSNLQTLAKDTNQLIDQILGQLCEAEITEPRDGAKCARTAPFMGGCRFVPDTIRLWISVAPHEATLHYPQMRVTRDALNRWRATNVHLGDDRSNGQTFTVSIILADEEVDKAMEAYTKQVRDAGNNPGIDLTEWKPSQWRVLRSVDVKRDDNAQHTPARGQMAEFH